MENKILAEICKNYNTSIEEIFKESRVKKHVFYRQLFFYFIRKNTKKTYFEIVEITKFYGKKITHGNIIYSINCVKNRIIYDAKFRKKIIKLNKKIQNSFLPDIVISEINLLNLCEKG